MNFFKVFGIVLLFILSLFSASAVVLNDAVIYYSVDDANITGTNPNDLSGNGNDGTMSGVPTTGLDGILRQSYFLTTSEVYVDTGYSTNPTSGTYSIWIKTNMTNSLGGHILADRVNSATTPYMSITEVPLGDTLNYKIRTGGVNYNIAGTINVSDNQWHHIVFSWGSGGMKTFVDGVSDGTNAYTGAWSNGQNLRIGHMQQLANYDYEGLFDEFAFYDRQLNDSEVAALYNSGLGFNPYIPSSTGLININISDGNIFNVSTLNISMNSTDLLNMSVYLNDVLNSTFLNTNLTSIVLDFPEQVNNISFKGELNGEVNWNNISITNDFTAPNISIIGNLSQPQFEVNFSTIFNVTDALSGMQSCTLNATYLENVTNSSQFNKFVNCTDTTIFEAAGLYNGFIIAKDNANNTETLSVNGTIEPFVLINFFDVNNTAISNYDGQIIHPNNFTESFTNTSNPLQISPFFNGSLDLGTYTIIFSKLGFNTSSVTIDINVSSGGTSYNFTVPGARIEIQVFDITDYTLINNTNTTIEIIGSSFSQIYVTQTGVLNISSLLMEEETYNIIVSNSNFETSTTSFNYDNQEVLDLDVYLTPLAVNGSLIADIIVRGVDDYQSPLRGFNAIQYVWDSGQSRYVQANLKKTDYDGETSFKVFLNTKLYNFCIEYLGVQYCENDVSVNINTQEIVIEVPVSELDIFNRTSIYDIDFSYSLTNSTTNINGTNFTSVTFNYNNPNQDVEEYCLKIYEIINLQRTLVANQCDTAHSGGLSVNILENTSKNYVAIATIEFEDNIRELDQIFLYATYNVQDELDFFGLVKIIIIAAIGFVIGVALHRKVHNVLIAHGLLPVVFLAFVFIFPKYVSFESFVLVTLTNIFAWNFATKKDDVQREKKFATLNAILALYIIFIFGLFTALTEIDSKGMLDDYGQTILSNIQDDNSYFNNYLDTSIDNLKTERANANTGAWDLLTGIFLKTLEFVDMFFSIMSNLFSIATNIGLIVGIQNALLLKFIKLIDYTIVAFVVYLYFKEAFK